MIDWMLYTAAVGLCIAAAARSAEWLARLGGYRVRFIWIGALVLSVVLPATVALRRPEPVTAMPDPGHAVRADDATNRVLGGSWLQTLGAWLGDMRTIVGSPLRITAGALRDRVPPVVNRYMSFVVAIASAGVLLVLVGVGRRFRRARREWPVVTIDGVNVRVAPGIGPIVIGLVRPDIVVPRWLLGRPAGEQRLVVAHEDEHVRARDPLLLGVGWLAMVVLPWNPAVWYMVSRLRLAVELDCDARVLRRGALPQSYGTLLIDLAQHASTLRVSALALADDASHLHQRILAMKRTTPRFARLRAGGASIFALGSLIVACQETLPAPSPAALSEKAPGELALVEKITTTAVTDTESVKLRMKVTEKPGTRIRLRQAPADRHDGGTKSVVEAEELELPAKVPAREPRVLLEAPVEGSLLRLSPKQGVEPLIFIDGVRAANGSLKALDPAKIEAIEVLKGSAARVKYGEEAAAGVIVITLKPRE
jgi:bla regulator protein blaR1